MSQNEGFNQLCIPVFIFNFFCTCQSNQMVISFYSGVAVTQLEVSGLNLAAVSGEDCMFGALECD